jgi:hypothetical protein
MSATPMLEEKPSLLEVQSAQGLRLYDERLKPLLEPQQNGQIRRDPTRYVGLRRRADSF